MQDRYAGDVGDFGKLGMLRKIADSGLCIGVNWYLTFKPEEHNNADGKHLGYMYDNTFKGCDDDLLKSLNTITRGIRSVAALEDANLIPNACYYSKVLRPGSDNSFLRTEWFNDSMIELMSSDIIFCDPDNGLIVKSVSEKSNKSDKYILHNELISYYKAGKSVVFYNHRCREKEEVYLKRFHTLKYCKDLMGAEWRGLKFVRGTIRDYIFILQPKHIEIVDNVLENIMNTNWRKHFSLLTI